ncbi:thioredoxin-like domain-containing protein [Flavobacterium sp. DGU38]|uniref:Thioredoxin-like domain-containing protein n=1 Tax=Flavobacterium calami TaxID=3139144 RepID=A0ABU9IRZ4_9FLAO
MRKKIILLALFFVSYIVFSQKTIENPQYGLSNLPGKLTKIELTDSATIIHFYIKYQPGKWISVPKNTYIQDVNGAEKYTVVQTEGIALGEKYTIPESGEVNYKIIFPKLKSGVNKVDFGEGDNNSNTWAVYDIVINNQESSVLPNELQGNWFLSDGSNQWDYGFYTSNAIIDKEIWYYKTVEKKKNIYTIVLEHNGKQKTVYAQSDKKRGISFGSDKQKLKSYSTAKIEYASYKLDTDVAYSDMVFKSDSATYSGVVQGYTQRAGRKTGTVYVNNIFTGAQNSYLIKIADDGSFSVKFPIDHPQFIFVRLPNSNSTVFVEPGKETFHLRDQNTALFMGDCARVNTDLDALNFISSVDYQKIAKFVSDTSPQDFKNSGLEIQKKQLKALNDFAQKQFISQKALQIKKLDIEFGAMAQILSYDIYHRGFKAKTSSKTSQSETKIDQDYKLEPSYYDFITESVLNNKIAVVTYEYFSFINRLRFIDVLRNNGGIFYTSFSETAEKLKKSGAILTKDELEMIAASKKTEKGMDKMIGFMKTNYQKHQEFRQNYKEIFTKLQKEKASDDISVLDVADYLSKNGTSLSSAEKEFITGYKAMDYTKEEQEIQKQFNDKYNEASKLFSEKYQAKIQEFRDEERFQNLKEKQKEVFGLNEAFVFDVITLQEKSKDLERNMFPYTESELTWIQGKIKTPFLSGYIVSENNRIKSKIETNKIKSDFTINTVKKTEGDELFDSMINKFKGKVIYVDFWATWCGPCMEGIKQIAPLKEEMKSENVVFLYITNPTSPEKSWNNNIPGINGEHYRVSQDEWNYLAQKFNISGIPHYVLVNKKGEVVNPKLGHYPNEALKGILRKEM